MLGRMWHMATRRWETDKNRIVPDEYSADIVRRIFSWKLKGMSAAGYCRQTESIRVIAPSEYKRLVGELIIKSGFQKKSRAQWSAASVIRILKTEFILVCLKQGKRVKINYKLDKTVSRPKEEWAVIENNRMKRLSVKQILKNVARLMRLDTRIAPKQEKLYLFSGLLFVARVEESWCAGRSNAQRIRDLLYLLYL